MKTYSKNQKSIFSTILLTAVIAVCFSVNVNAHTVARSARHDVAAADTGKMKAKADKMKAKKKKATKMDKKLEEDKMKDDKMASKM